MLSQQRALALLAECHGDHLWSLDHCRQRGVPEPWIDALGDGFESNPARHSQSIFTDQGSVNQYEGIRDVDLAQRLGRHLGVDVANVTATCLTRRGIVLAIQQAVADD
jgi:hypothetical protein